MPKLSPFRHLQNRSTLLIGLAIIALAIIAIYLQNNLPTSPIPTTQTPSPLTQTYPKVNISQTSHQQLIDELGTFEYQYTEEPYLVYAYPSPHSRYARNLFYLLNDTVVMKEINYNPNQITLSPDQLDSTYGSEFTTLYSQPSDLSPLLEIRFYQSQGLAIYIRQDLQAVTKIKQFPPISQDTFLTTWGKGAQTTKPATTSPSLHSHDKPTQKDQ